jgi:hypothetical protein
MVESLTARAGGLECDAELLLGLLLADEFMEKPWPQLTALTSRSGSSLRGGI